jgi:hypothetical protein
MESVIKQTYEIILTCNNKYKMNSSFKTCMDKHVYNVVNKSMNYVKRNPMKRDKSKEYIMSLVIDSLQECALDTYQTHQSRKRLDETIKCIQSNVKDLISVAVDAMSLSIQLSFIIS